MLIKIALLGLVLGVGFGSAHPSAAEFNLFCRILAKANDMMYGPDYVYDENVDQAILKDMEVLYNATTSNMNEFRKTLWVTKDFFEEHPPPMDAKNRQDAHREIDKLIRDGEKKIEENKKIEEKVNKEINKAKLWVAKGIFGEEVKEPPKQDGNLTKILNKPESIFNDKDSPTRSCGDKGDKAAGKTLLNDFFCVCVGDGKQGDTSDGPCSPHILPSNYGGKGGWKKIKLKNKEALEFNQSFKQIEKACREELMREAKQTKDMNSLLDEYVGMIWNGTEEREAKGKKFFGHSERQKKDEVTKCDGGQGASSYGTGNSDYQNEHICVDYRHNLNGDGHYDIPWHNKFKSYSTLLKDAKRLEDQILKNRAALLLLKSQAWVAYSREKDDETSNLDDMNASDKKDTMAEKKSEARKYIDVPSQSTQGSQPSQPVQGQGAPGNPPHYILISSTETSQPSPKKTDEGKGGGREEPEVTVISSESTTQEGPPPSQGPSQATSQPPAQSAKRLREENKTGE